MLQLFERIIKLLIAQLAGLLTICFIENRNQSSFECFDESWRLDIDFLAFFDVFRQVLDLHDIVFWHERINFLSFHVDETGVFKLSAEMELQFNFEFVFKHTVNPSFEHVIAHSAVQFMFERLVFKIEFNFVTVLLN